MSAKASLRWRLSVVIIALSMINLLGTIAASLIMASTYSDDAARRNLNLATAVSRQVAFILDLPKQDLLRFAQKLDIEKLDIEKLDSPDGSELLELPHRLFTRLEAVNEEGYVIATVPVDAKLIGLDRSGHSYLKAVLENHIPVWSPTGLSQIGKQETHLVLPLAEGALIGTVDLEAVGSLVDLESLEDQAVVILDQDGTIIYHSDRERSNRRENISNLMAAQRAMAGQSGTIDERIDDDKCIVSYASVSDTGWSVLVVQPEKAALGHIRQVWWILIGGVTLGILATLIVILLVVGRFLKPIRKLTADTALIADGITDIAPKGEYQELEELSTTFTRMAAAVEDRQRALAASREEYRELIQRARGPILRLDADGNIKFVNRSAEKLFGIDRKSARGQSPVGLLIPDSEKNGNDPKKIILDAIADPEQFPNIDLECRGASGETLWVSWSLSSITDGRGGEPGLLAIGTDITKQRRAESVMNALVRSVSAVTGQDFFDTMTATITEWLGADAAMVSRLQSDGRLEILSAKGISTEGLGACMEVAGTPCERAIAEGFYQIQSGLAKMFPEAGPLVAGGFDSYLGHAVYDQDCQVIGVFSSFGKGRMTIPPDYHRVLEVMGNRIAAELSRLEAERQLQRQQKLLDSFIMHLPGPAGIIDTNGIPHYANSQLNELINDPGQHDGVVRILKSLAMGVDPDGGNHISELAMLINQEERLFRALSFKIPSPENKLIAVILVDITEQKSLEEQVQRGQKMDAIGQLAGGVSHDFNNQLTGIQGHAELLQRRITDPKLSKHIDNILTATTRSTDLIRQLLTFSRQQSQAFKTIDMHELIDESITLLERTLDKRVTIERKLEGAPASVLGDPSSLQNAIVNLALNARDAMSDGGVLTISTTLTHGMLEHSTSAVAKPLWKIELSDTGSGMDAATVDRIFEPFFTTKSEKGGTGLGLATVYGTIQNHKGTIKVRSNLGEGTTFTILLPAAGADEPTVPTATMQRTPINGSGRILLIDDEEHIRQIATEVLTESGYEVVVAENGQQALEIWQQDGAFDLVLLDMMMPVMDGATTFRALKNLKPSVRVLVVSGYSHGNAIAEVLNGGARAHLMKPFTIDSLITAVEKHIH